MNATEEKESERETSAKITDRIHTNSIARRESKFRKSAFALYIQKPWSENGKLTAELCTGKYGVNDLNKAQPKKKTHQNDFKQH